MVKSNLLFLFGFVVIFVFGLASCLPPPDLSDPDPVVVSGTGTGLMGSYFDSQSVFVGSRVDSEVSFFWVEGSSPLSGVPSDFFSVVWTGDLEAPLSGDYVFSVFGDDGVRVFVDGVNVLPNDAWSAWNSGQSELDRVFSSNGIGLEKGKKYSFRIEFFDYNWNAGIQLNWTRPDDVNEIIPMMYLYSGSPVNDAPEGLPYDDSTLTPVCGNGIIESGEECDNSSMNGISCNPPYGGSCNYCSSTCGIVTLTDSTIIPPAKNNDPLLPGTMANNIYTADMNTIFTNPERGWYSTVSIRNPDGIAWEYANNWNQGRTVVIGGLRLDEYRNSDIPDSLLTSINLSLRTAKDYGIKVILRFVYNSGYEADAPLNIVLTHIEQLSPIIKENSDVVAVWQAGFIGAWGEWHASTNNLLTAENRLTISKALMDAIGQTRMIQIRTPYYARDIFDFPTEETAFDGSYSSRVGQKNDCFLSTYNDAGTYYDKEDYDYMTAVSRYAVVGGETCNEAGLVERNNCTNSIAEMKKYSWDYLHRDYWTPIYDRWQTEGCYDDVTRRLGYRLRLIDAAIHAQGTRGDQISVVINMSNDGFGKVYNPRPMDLVLMNTANSNDKITFRMYDDARGMLPLGGDRRQIIRNVRLPSSMNAGTYDAYLYLPDPSPRLSGNWKYSIRLANMDTWNQNTGYNNLGLRIQVI